MTSIGLQWASDVHWGHADQAAREAFLAYVSTLASRGYRDLLITGDLSNGAGQADACDLLGSLEELGVLSGIFFVLGNHDYWGFPTRRQVEDEALSLITSETIYLSASYPVFLSQRVALVGVDGLADGRAGVGVCATHKTTNDPSAIGDWARKVRDPVGLARLMAKWGRDDADALLRRIRAAVRDGARYVICASHAPPFVDLNTFGGAPDPHALPWYIWVAGGEVLQKAADEFPEVRITSLSGHTHSYANCEYGPNLACRVADAQYGAPTIERCFDYPLE